MTRFMDNFYARLGVPRDATPEEIREAYRESARKFHPDTRDKNTGTELFLGIQQAYEVLAQPEKRAAYSKTLPPETSLDDVEVEISLSRSRLLSTDEPQLLYVLMEIKTPNGVPIRTEPPPLNIGLVIDRSTSMTGPRMDVVKAAARQLLRQLRPEDFLSIVAFSDRAEIVFPASRGSDYHRMDAKVSMIRTGGGTEMYYGLEAGISEIKRYMSPSYINQVILITDGHTYGDEAKCLELAEIARMDGITISGMGIGDEWNDVFLDRLTAKTGGNSVYISQSKDIKRFLEQKFSGISKIYAENVRLVYDLQTNAALRYAFRLKPDPSRIDSDGSISLGNVQFNEEIRVLLEILINDTEEIQDELEFLVGKLVMEIPTRVVPTVRKNLKIKCGVAVDVAPEPPPSKIVQAMSKLTLYRMQELAREDIEKGDIKQATRRLQNLATNLLAQGQAVLANTVLQEATLLEKGDDMSEEGAKQIKYGTRGLLLPPGRETLSWH